MKRLLKGFGDVSKMKGNHRNPYRVRIKIGDYFNKEKGTCTPIYKIIGYTKTKKDGIMLLQSYHDNPYSFENVMTFEEVYQETIKEFRTSFKI